MSNPAPITVTIPAYRAELARTILAKCHAADVRNATRAGRPTPAAPEFTITDLGPVRRCPVCKETSADLDRWICDRCGVRSALETLARVTLTSARPTIGRHELLGVIEPMPPDYLGNPSPNMLRAVPGATVAIPEIYRTADATACDHCRVARNRSETFAILDTERGGIVQVGRTCLAAYLGDDTYESLIARLDWTAELASLGIDADGEGGGGGGRGEILHAIGDVLAITRSVIRREGWISKGAAGPGSPSTASRVGYLINPPPAHPVAVAEWRKAWEALRPEAGDLARAAEALAWARGIEARSDYESNIRTIAMQAEISDRHLGLACSIMSAHDRECQRTTERARAAAANPTEYLGKPGDRVGGKLTAADRKAGKGAHPEISGKIERLHAIDGDFGVKTLIVVRDGTTLAHWWMTGAAGDTWHVGAACTLRGTIKRHEIDRRTGERVTTLTRCTLTFA